MLFDRTKIRAAVQAIGCALTLLSGCFITAAVEAADINPYMGAPVTLEKVLIGAIANKKTLDGIEKVGWIKPTIEQPVDGIWVLGGYGLAPISIIDTEDGLIAFDTGDSKHDGELLLEAIRTFSKKPVKVIILQNYRADLAQCFRLCLTGHL